jgi:hypothetical protein
LELKDDDWDFQVSFLRKSDKMAGNSFFLPWEVLHLCHWIICTLW